MKFGIEKEAELFKQHAYKSSYEIGLENKFDKVYKDKRAITNAVYSIFSKVKNNHEKYGIDKQSYDLVLDSVSQRRISRTSHKPVAPMDETVQDMRSLVLDSQDIAARIVNKKLRQLDSSPRRMKNISLKEMTTSFAIIFDKARLLKGEPTEHIMHYSRISKDMTAEDALIAVQKMREENVTD